MDFHEKVCEYIYQQFPDIASSLSPDVVHEYIKDDSAKAHRYGFRVESDVVRFIDLLWRIDRSFDSSPDFPWAKDILNDVRIMPVNKIEMLRDAYAMHCAHQKADVS